MLEWLKGNCGNLLGGPVLSASSQWNITPISTTVSNLTWRPVQLYALYGSIFFLWNFVQAFFLFLWGIGINYSVRLNSSVLRFPFFMNVPVCISSWVFMALSQLLFTLRVALQSLWIFISLPDGIKCLDCDLGQCVCVCFSSASQWYQMYFSPSLQFIRSLLSFSWRYLIAPQPGFEFSSIM